MTPETTPTPQTFKRYQALLKWHKKSPPLLEWRADTDDDIDDDSMQDSR